MNLATNHTLFSPVSGSSGFVSVVLFCKGFFPACKRISENVHFLTHAAESPWEMLRLFPKRWKADSAERSQRVSKVITTATASGRPGKEQGLINDNARSAGGEEPKWAGMQRCRVTV